MIPGDFILAEGEKYVACPYNVAHIVTNLRLSNHLHKCRKEYEKECARTGKPKDMRHCRFNDKHIIPGPEINIHEEKCADAHKILETVRYHQSAEFQRSLEEDHRRRKEQEEALKAEQSSSKPVWGQGRGRGQNFSAPTAATSPANANVWGDDTEDWESTASQGYEAAYNPEERMKIDGSLYQPRGLSKSERKKFRAEQKLLAEQRDPNIDLKEMKESFGKLGLADENVPENVNVKKEPKDEWLPTIKESKREGAEIKKEIDKKFGCDEDEDECFGEDPFA